MNEVVPFDFDGASVRVVMRDGEAWFVAADVAALLGYSDAHRMVRYLDADEKGAVILASPSGAGEEIYVLVSESGLYEAIFRSSLLEAERFRKWVTSEVLPSIRKTGRYLDRYAIPDNKTAIASVEFEAYKRVADAFGLTRNAALIAADNAVARDYGISFREKLQITLQAEGNEGPILLEVIG